ncbi:MAG: hypothetical protein ACK5JS_00575 [Mangrovibacterium sp.]
MRCSNPNTFYKRAAIKNPLFSPKAELKEVQLPQTVLMDFNTEAGGVYHFSLN